MSDAGRQVPCSTTPHDRGGMPEPWIVAHAGLVPAGTEVLDLAGGGGRHARFFAERGHPVLLVDRTVYDWSALTADGRVTTLIADLEANPWPLAGRQFGGIIVTNYLWRALLTDIVAAVAPGGVLLYSTFAVGQERYGRPNNPDFLLKPGELLAAVRGRLDVRAQRHGNDGQAVRQSIAAVRPV